jgi:hypothetical protein
MLYASIRKYRGMRSPEEAAKRAEKGFVPILKQLGGFKGYYLIDCGGGIVATISLFDTRETTLASNEKASAWVKANLADLVGEEKQPEIVAGEARIAITN